MKNPSKNASPASNRVRELRSELARKIASFMGSEENRATDIPGVTLHRRIAPTAPCSATYEPGVTVMAQGRKRVNRHESFSVSEAASVAGSAGTHARRWSGRRQCGI